MAAPKFYLSRCARADLDSIAAYLADQGTTAPRRVLTELWNTFEFLAANPEIGNRRDDLHPNVRMFTPSRPAGSYIVFYYSRTDGVEISDVIHAARDWPVCLLVANGSKSWSLSPHPTAAPAPAARS